MFDNITFFFKEKNKKCQSFKFNHELSINNDIFFIEYKVKDKFIDFSITLNKSIEIEYLYLETTFNENIKYWRNQEYNWIIPKSTIISDLLSPKIVQLSNNILVGATNVLGSWEFNPKKARNLKWFLVHYDLNPTFQFNSAFRDFNNSYLFSKGYKWEFGFVNSEKSLPEWSRSKIGFSAIAIFTDHCDYDTLVLLQKQRELLNNNSIVATKGLFFLDDNSSIKESVNIESKIISDELSLWKESGHELAFHSLFDKISKESKPINILNLKKDKNITSDIKTWIDHGYHSYNFSMLNKEESIKNAWNNTIIDNGIEIIWNYVDSFDGSILNINQLDRSKTSIKSIFKTREIEKFKNINRSIYQIFRNILRYNTNEKIVQFSLTLGVFFKYRSLKNLKKIIILSKYIFTPLCKPLFWIHLPNKLNKYSAHNRFCPTVFRMPNNKKIFIFQTIAIRDFESAFNSETLNSLIDSKGIFISHNYFAYTFDSHKGRIFLNKEGFFNDAVELNFTNLGNKIKEGAIWNPTLIEAKKYWEIIIEMRLTNESGKLKWEDFGLKIPVRNVLPLN